ncbi:hypothetical protein [Achromobacter aegrifaciens]|uniref:hypothetical protein n=1 Tax=Achromobacter aegrifaciens TaxID=1287736 RepID=UPI001AD84E9A|nr:hypothetical protein [Achromobacter aegrifaciens]
MDEIRQREEAMRAHTEAVNAGRLPKFGDRMRNLWAGEGNPRRDATFVRRLRRTGQTNPGTWYEMTDERGAMWLSNPDSLIFCDLIGASDALGGPFAQPHPDNKDGGANE